MVFWIRISFLFHEVRIFYILNYDFLLRLHNLISSLKNNIYIVYMVFEIGFFFFFSTVLVKGRGPNADIK